MKKPGLKIKIWELNHAQYSWPRPQVSSFLRLFSKLSLSCARPCGHLQSWPLPDGGCTEGPANSEIPVDLSKRVNDTTRADRLFFFFFNSCLWKKFRGRADILYALTIQTVCFWLYFIIKKGLK